MSSPGLGQNKWGEIKKIAKPDPPAEVEGRAKSSALIDLAPPPRVPPSVQVERAAVEAVPSPVASPPTTSTGPQPPAGAHGSDGVELAPKSERVARAKIVKPPAGPKGRTEFVETSIYVSRVVADAFRDGAARRSMLMNQLIVDLASQHGAALEQRARAAGRQPARRRSGERVVDPIRKVLNFTAGELAQLDKIAERCSWPRSRVVSELMKLA